MKSALFDLADTWLFRAWLASIVGFVLAARADMAIADWLLPVALLPLLAVVVLLCVGTVARLLRP